MQKKGGSDGPTLPRMPTEDPPSLGPSVGRAQWRTGTLSVAPEWFTYYRTAPASRHGEAGVGGGEGRVKASEGKVDTGNH